MDASALILLAAIVVAAVFAISRLGGKSTQAAAPTAGAATELQRVKVQHVIDGDTVIVSEAGSDIRVRLDAIDCPERGQHWGNISTAGLIKLIGGRYVRMEAHGVDIHGRTIATVYVQHGNDSEWINVNERMVMLGHAWVMRKYYDHLPRDRQHQLNKLEAWARSKRVGLWKTNDAVPPWLWRDQD